jgi:23S rRNA (guanosine2251-2'-O)-methyltransferase
VVALDEVQDPQNFGAVIRSAVAMGASAVVWPEHRSAPLSPATFRASAGAVEHARLCRVTALPTALGTLRDRGVTVVGLDMGGDASIDRVDLARPVALVVGAEGKGLRKTVKH